MALLSVLMHDMFLLCSFFFLVMTEKNIKHNWVFFFAEFSVSNLNLNQQMLNTGMIYFIKGGIGSKAWLFRKKSLCIFLFIFFLCYANNLEQRSILNYSREVLKRVWCTKPTKKEYFYFNKKFLTHMTKYSAIAMKQKIFYVVFTIFYVIACLITNSCFYFVHHILDHYYTYFILLFVSYSRFSFHFSYKIQWNRSKR